MPFTLELVAALGKALRPVWQGYVAHREALVPLATLAGGAVAAWVALGQLNTARRRHEAQTEADLQRRITENYTKAVEQLGSDKLQVRIGGIFALERISQESARDYWTVMETLTAFVRERARWKERDDTDLSRTEAGAHADKPQHHAHPPTDIQAVLTVIVRRSEAGREREKREGWRFDLRSSDFGGADLRGAHFERAYLQDAHFEGAYLYEAHFEGARLDEAHFEEARLQDAHFEGAYLREAHFEEAGLQGAHFEGADLDEAHFEEAGLEEVHFEGADLRGAHLEGAGLEGAYFEGAKLEGAHFEGADLRGRGLYHATHLEGAKGLTQDQLDSAIGDRETTLPAGLTRPAHWTAAAQDGVQVPT